MNIHIPTCYGSFLEFFLSEPDHDSNEAVRSWLLRNPTLDISSYPYNR